MVDGIESRRGIRQHSITQCLYLYYEDDVWYLPKQSLSIHNATLHFVHMTVDRLCNPFLWQTTHLLLFFPFNGQCPDPSKRTTQLPDDLGVVGTFGIS